MSLVPTILRAVAKLVHEQTLDVYREWQTALWIPGDAPLPEHLARFVEHFRELEADLRALEL
jgi:hypothetical protein